MAAAGNASYGYFGGGQDTNPGFSTVNRVDYSNDTATAAVKGPLSAAIQYIAATGNTSYGYFGGGDYPAKSTVNRIDYSSDTGTTPTKGPLATARYWLMATGNGDYGYFGGGDTASASDFSTVERIDYASDTDAAAPKGPLTSTRKRGGATSSLTHGYFGGGSAPSSTSSVDRIDYSNDSATAVEKGPLPNTAFGNAGVSSRMNGFSSSDRSNNQGIISYSDSGGNEDATTCQFDTDIDGKVKFSSSAGIVTSTSALPSGTWAHAAITRTDNTISVYINGVLENTGITTHTFSDYAKVTIGANRPRSTFFKGDIAQVQIYKKALSSDEVQQNYRSIKKRFDL